MSEDMIKLLDDRIAHYQRKLLVLESKLAETIELKNQLTPRVAARTRQRRTTTNSRGIGDAILDVLAETAKPLLSKELQRRLPQASKVQISRSLNYLQRHNKVSKSGTGRAAFWSIK